MSADKPLWHLVNMTADQDDDDRLIVAEGIVASVMQADDAPFLMRLFGPLLCLHIRSLRRAAYGRKDHE